ncbi:MAG: zinc-binding dehydrogenase, partial [Thermoanaerobaculia bacterium]
TGGDLWNVLTTQEERLQRSRALFDSVLDGTLTVKVSRRFPLEDGATAHAFLEGRGSIGKVILTVG